MDIKLKALLKSLRFFRLPTGSCSDCDIEALDCFSPKFDLERFGITLVSSIKHADVLLITGAGNRKSLERVTKMYEQMPKPCFVIALGKCALSRGMFIDSYNCPIPLDKIIPVDIYVPGCPPRPQAIIAGIQKLIEKNK